MAEKCGAKTRSGGACKRSPVEGRTRCRLHGGASLVGPAHPSFKTGRYSRWSLPDEIKDAWQRAREAPELMGMGDEVALLDARLYQLLDRIAKAEPSAAAFARAQKAYDELRAATAANRPGRMRAATADLEEALRDGAEVEATWAQVVALVGEGRKLRDSERRRVEAGRAYLTAEAAMAMVAKVIEVCRRYLPPDKYSEFAVEMNLQLGLAPRKGKR